MGNTAGVIGCDATSFFFISGKTNPFKEVLKKSRCWDLIECLGENMSLLRNANIEDFLNFFKLFLTAETLREKCPNTESFLVRNFPHSDWIRRDTWRVFGHFSRSILNIYNAYTEAWISIYDHQKTKGSMTLLIPTLIPKLLFKSIINVPITFTTSTISPIPFQDYGWFFDCESDLIRQVWFKEDR